MYGGNGDEIRTYTAGVGWHEKKSRAETVVHGALKATYYAVIKVTEEIRECLKPEWAFVGSWDYEWDSRNCLQI